MLEQLENEGNPFNCSNKLAFQLKVHLSNAWSLAKDQQEKIFMSTYLLNAICARQQFHGIGWAWTPSESSVNIYCKALSNCSYWGVMARISDHFVAPLYMMIFEKDPPYMS